MGTVELLLVFVFDSLNVAKVLPGKSLYGFCPKFPEFSSYKSKENSYVDVIG